MAVNVLTLLFGYNGTHLQVNKTALHLPHLAFGTYKSGIAKVELQKRIIHQNAVTRVRHMPQKPKIIAATSTCSLSLFDTDNKHYSITEEDSADFAVIPDTFSKPLLQLKGFNSFNGTVDWNINEPGCLLGSGDQKSIGMWDICSQNSTDNFQHVTTVFTGHSGAITDISWWSSLTTVFLSSSVDCTIGIWDIRSRNHSVPSHSVAGHKMPITSVAASPFSQFVFASTSEDSTVALWDIRNLTVKLHSLSNKPNDFMYNARWSPHSPNLIASSTASRTVCIWDLDALHDMEKMQSATQDDPAELLFLHGGHSATIGDFDWHPEVRNLIGSTAHDNIIQIWKPIEILIASGTPPPSQPEVVPNHNLTMALESDELPQ